MIIFVDTNILIDYVNRPEIKHFIDNSNDVYFYTETVKYEYEKRKRVFDISKFRYINSDRK